MIEFICHLGGFVSALGLMLWLIKSLWKVL